MNKGCCKASLWVHFLCTQNWEKPCSRALNSLMNYKCVRLICAKLYFKRESFCIYSKERTICNVWISIKLNGKIQFYLHVPCFLGVRMKLDVWFIPKRNIKDNHKATIEIRNLHFSQFTHCLTTFCNNIVSWAILVKFCFFFFKSFNCNTHTCA